MDYEINLSEDGCFGFLSLSKPFTKESGLEIYKKVLEFKAENSLDFFLCDFRKAPLNLSSFDQYDFVYSKSKKMDNHPCRKLALLVNKDDHSYEFIEVLFFNTGRAIKLFTQYEDAIDWLLKQA
jgi:hypothetical protein